MTNKTDIKSLIDALAEFWDTHDVTDFMDAFEELSEPVFESQTEQLTIRLLPEEIHRIQQIAAEQGTSQTALIRHWVLEKISPPLHVSE